MNALSMYLHIPFCRHRCAYCDFNTYTTVGELQEVYVAALVQEIEQVAALAAPAGQLHDLQTVYLGGGTPSLLSVEAIAALLTATSSAFGLSPAAEISLEMNPDTVDQAYLAGLRASGVNRLSMGVQSAMPGELALLERTHDFGAVVDAVRWARMAGFANINLDLIYGLPGQTLASWRQSLEAVLALRPEHLSLYCLTIEPGTPMQRWLLSGRITAPDPDLAAAQYELAAERLADGGYEHYEISNWALPGRACAHNLVYWRNQPYLGLGAGAHGHAAGRRYAVVKRPRDYIRRMTTTTGQAYPLSAAVAEWHVVERAEAMSDTVITQLRLLNEGLDLRGFEARFGQALDNAYGGLVADLIDWGLLQQKNGSLLLTERGRFLSNQVFYRFM